MAQMETMTMIRIAELERRLGELEAKIPPDVQKALDSHEKRISAIEQNVHRRGHMGA